ncbi:MAG TPA: hypothetical protein VNM90_16555 [Haliangium sp.]|nr:hypothetical protein [Haliangium sp.]
MHRGRVAESAPQPQPQYPMAGQGVPGAGAAGVGPVASRPAAPAAPIGLKTALGQLDDEDFSGAKTIGVSGDLVRQVLDNLPEPPPAAPPLAGGFGPPPAAPPPAGAGFGAPPAGMYGPAGGGFGAPPPVGGFGVPPPAAPPVGGAPWGAPPPAYPPAYPVASGMGGQGPWGAPAPVTPSPFEAPAGVQPPRHRFGPPAADEMATMIAQPRAAGTPPVAPAGMATMMPAGGAPAMPVHGPPSMPPGMAPLVPGMLPGQPLDGPKTVALSPEAAAAHFQQHTPPPYLASTTIERMGAPQEPWASLLGTLLLVFGIGLIACFVLPWSIGDEVSFSWTAIAGWPGAAKLAPLLIGITGVLGVVFGLLPLDTVQRGIAAAGTAGLALMLQSMVVNGFSFTGMFGFLTALTLVSGLLLRSEYQAALLPRVLTTVGVVFFLMSLLVPSGGQVPIAAHIGAVGDMPGRMKIVAILTLFWDVVPFLALLCWLPPPGAAGTKVLAWLLITQPVVMSLITGVVQPHEGGLVSGLMGGIYSVFLAPVVAMAWIALLGYGIATVVGKQLEHP